MQLPPIYWINLARATDRRARMTERFESRGLQHVRVEGVDASAQDLTRHVRWSDAHAGPPMPCWRSIDRVEAAVVAAHLRAVKRAHDDGLERALILEDDVTFELMDRWPAGWSAVTAALPPRFGIAQLCIASNIDRLNALFVEQGYLSRIADATVASAAAYLIERPAMRALLDAFDRGDHFDISSRSAPAEHVLFGGPVMAAPDIDGPWLTRIPLFLYEGGKSLIAEHHNDFLRPSRAYVLAHHGALVEGTFRPSFPGFDTFVERPEAPAPGWRPWARTPLRKRQQRQREWLMSPLGLRTYLGGARKEAVQTLPLADGDVIWAPTEQLELVARARHRRPFVLVTQSQRGRTPSDHGAARDHILNDAMCRGWFSTHAYFERDGRITPMPVGIDADRAGELYPDRSGDAARVRRYGEALQQHYRALATWAPPPSARMPLALVDLAEPDARSGFSENVCCLPDIWNVGHKWATASRCAAFVAPLDGRDATSIWTALLHGLVVAAPRWPRSDAVEALPFLWFERRSDLTEALILSRRHDAHALVRRYLSFGFWYAQITERLAKLHT